MKRNRLDDGSGKISDKIVLLPFACTLLLVACISYQTNMYESFPAEDYVALEPDPSKNQVKFAQRNGRYATFHHSSGDALRAWHQGKYVF
jgi:hypothetical protein